MMTLLIMNDDYGVEDRCDRDGGHDNNETDGPVHSHFLCHKSLLLSMLSMMMTTLMMMRREKIK